MRKIKILWVIFAVAMLGACAGGDGGKDPAAPGKSYVRSPVAPDESYAGGEGGKDLAALDAQYIARTSSLNSLTEGLKSGDGKAAHDAALNEFYDIRKINRGENWNREDYVKEANRPENYADGTARDENLDAAHDAAQRAYDAARTANTFGKNTALAWGGTFSGPVVAEQWSGPLVRDWIDNGTITLELSKIGSNLSASFATKMSDPSNDRHGDILYTATRNFWYTERSGNDVTAIAGQFQQVDGDKTNNFYFSAGK